MGVSPKGHVPTERGDAVARLSIRRPYRAAEEIAHALAGLPSSLRANIKAIEQSPGLNPRDNGYAEVFGWPGFFSEMAADRSTNTIKMYAIDKSWQNNTRLDATLLHESAHLFFSNFQQQAARGQVDPSAWEVARRSDHLAPSNYAELNRNEDFSESVLMYVSHVGTPKEAGARQMFPARWKLLSRLFPDVGHGSEPR
jgi:hypothetical protein